MNELEEDHYSLLGVSRDASSIQIKEAFRDLAMKWHPDKNLEKKEQCQQVFQRLSNAYSVLINKDKRMEYDKSFNCPAKYSGRKEYFPRQTEFDCLYNSFYGKDGYITNMNRNSSNFLRNGSKDDEICFSGPQFGDINVPVYCTLEELFFGTNRIYNVLTAANGKKKFMKCKVGVTPGLPIGFKITLNKQGNQNNEEKSDIIFEILDLPHPRYTRVEYDIFETRIVSLKEVQNGKKITIQCIDGDYIDFSIMGLIEDGFIYTLPNRGLLNDKTRGNHCIRFFINNE